MQCDLNAPSNMSIKGVRICLIDKMSSSSPGFIVASVFGYV